MTFKYRLQRLLGARVGICIYIYIKVYIYFLLNFSPILNRTRSIEVFN